MKFSAPREVVLAPLQHVVGAVERRQTAPILGNVLFEVDDGYLTLTATDSEIELQARVELPADQDGSTTLPARKLLDICRNLPESGKLDLQLSGEKLSLKSGRSRFTLATLPASDFPKVDALQSSQVVRIAASALHHCLKNAAFSMAHQDVRFYLNGMLLEIAAERLSCVATDGHRLAYAQSAIDAEPETPVRAIVPRKSINELLRLMGTADEDLMLELAITSQHLQIQIGGVRMTTKLIDGRFPDYNRVIPIDGNKELVVDIQSLKQCLTRASVLSNEKYRGVRIALESGLLTISSNNPDQEEAIDELEVDYSGDSTEIGFNVTYLLDVLNVIEGDLVRLVLKDGNSSVLMTPDNETTADTKYVVMPMRL
ncbi:MAG: DNA polymerase III subunit beta [Granulosicoccus sp.]|nr:DNA polymerase III subunit beta [Granulosicoccus sp.]